MRKHIAIAVAAVAIAGVAVAGGLALRTTVGDAVASDAGREASLCTSETGSGRGNGRSGGEGLGQGAGGEARESGTHVTPDPLRPLTADEAADLAFMREEEKLARDVYVALGDMYDLSTFDTIAASETRHMDSLKTLLDAFSLDDPVSANADGEFTDSDLSTLYGDLMAQGDDSLADALRVAVAVEEKDIADLEERIAATDRADLDSVYGNLLRASQNHLRAFTAQLERVEG